MTLIEGKKISYVCKAFINSISSKKSKDQIFYDAAEKLQAKKTKTVILI